MFLRTIAVVLLVLANLPATGYAQAKWSNNIPQAMRRARVQKKDLLLNFTGSDWCHWCDVLEEEVFAHKQFSKKAGEQFVFVTLDFPVDAARQDPRLAKQNHEWMRKLAVDGFPTVVLCDAAGRPYAQMGYEEGGSKPYLKRLNRYVEQRVKRDHFLAQAATLEGLAKARKLHEALSVMDSTVVAQAYKPEMAEILKHAGDDKTLISRYETLQLIGKQRTAMTELGELCVTKDKKKILERVEELEELFPPSCDARAEFDCMRIEVLSQSELHAEAIKAARKMLGSNSDQWQQQVARETILQSLIFLDRTDEAVGSAKQWSQLEGLDTDGKVTLQAYGVQALIAGERKDEAVKVAADVLTDVTDVSVDAEYAVDWLREVIKKDGTVPSINDFMYGDGSTVAVSKYWIGVLLEPVTEGLRVVEVVPDAPAAVAKFKAEDVLQSANGQPLASIDSLITVIGDNGPKPLAIVALRDKEEVLLRVTPVKRPGQSAGRSNLELGPIPDHWERDLDTASDRAKKEDKEVVAFFSAKWCGPCQVMLTESIPDETVTDALKDRIVVYVEVDSESGAAAAETHQIDAIPAFLFLSREKKELGRARGLMGAEEFVDTVRSRGAKSAFEVADANRDGRLRLGEFRKYIRKQLGDNVPFRKVFNKLDKDTDERLSPKEFEDRRVVIEKFLPKPAVESYPDPGKDFVAYPGGSSSVNDAKVFGALVHRYQDAIRDERTWASIDVPKVPTTIDRPDLSSAVACKTAHDLAKASLIVAGGDELGAGFFTAGAVLISADGLAVTNYHVIEDAEKTKLIAMDANGKTHRVVEVLAGSKERDVALIRIEGDGFHAVKIAKNAPTPGHNLTLMHHSEMRFFTYDRGYVMRYSQISGQPWMEISAQYAPGGSGCGIFNKQHELVGLVSSITMGDGPDLAADDSLENEHSELEEWDDDEPIAFGSLVVKHAVPWSAIQSLWKQ